MNISKGENNNHEMALQIYKKKKTPNSGNKALQLNLPK